MDRPLVYLLFCTSKNGWGWDKFLKEADTGTGMRFPHVIRQYMRIGVPLIIAVIYLKGYYDMFSPRGPLMLTVWMVIAFAMLALILSFARSKKK